MGLGSSLICPIHLNTSLTDEQKLIYQNPEEILKILNTFRTIAIVGLSSDNQKASYFVASYLKYAGYNVIPVNPKSETILGLKCYPNLSSIPEKVDLVDIFRPIPFISEIVDEAIAIQAKGVWQQLKIINLEAAEKARKAGLYSIVDLCVKMEHGRYSGGLHESGMNTEIISAHRVHRFF